MVSDKMDFFNVFPYISLFKICDPRGGAIFGPRGIIWTNLVEVHYVMLHTKHQGSRPYGFRQEDFSTFSLLSLCKTCDPRGRAIFGPGGIILTNLVEVH